MKKTTNNTVVLTETEITSENSKTILLRLHGDQSQVNPAAIPHFLDSENIEFAARLHELPYAQAYSEVVRPSRIIGLTSDNSAASLEIGIANSNPSEGLTPLSNNPLTIPVSDSAPSFLISDNFLESADNRERIIPLPAEELSLESASGFINGFLANILPIPEEAIIGLCQTPSLAADTRNVINALRQDLIDTMNDQTSSRALARFEEFRALQNRIYEQSQLYHLGQPLPQKTYYTLWKFILFKIFSLFSKDNIDLLISYLNAIDLTTGSCACLMLLFILRPLFLTYLDVRFWRNSVSNVRIIILRVLYDIRNTMAIASQIRISQFDIRARFQRGVGLFNTRIDASVLVANQVNETGYANALEAIRLYRLERRGISIQDATVNLEVTSSIVNNAEVNLRSSNDEIRRDAEIHSIFGFLRYFRRGGSLLIITGSLTILLNSSIRSKIYEFVSNLLKEATKISNTPTSAPTAGISSAPPSLSLAPIDVVGPSTSPFTLPSLDFILEAIEEGLNWFF